VATKHSDSRPGVRILKHRRTSQGAGGLSPPPPKKQIGSSTFWAMTEICAAGVFGKILSSPDKKKYFFRSVTCVLPKINDRNWMSLWLAEED